MIEESNALEYARLTCPNHISLQDHPFIRPIETSLIPLLVYRSSLNLLMKGSLIKQGFGISYGIDHRLLFIPSFDYLYLYHIPFLPKTPYSLYLYSSFIIYASYSLEFRFFHVLGAPLFMVFILIHLIRGT